MPQDVTALLSRYRLVGAGNGSASASKSRDEWLRKEYGVGVDVYEQLLRAQGGCAICHKSERDEGQSLSVDHDHATGRVRGLLCRACNAGLGNYGDDANRLRAAATYLDHGGTAGPQHQPRKR